MMNTKSYIELKNQLSLFYQEYVKNHTLDECVDYYYFLENNAEEDALSFAVPMIEKYIDELDSEIYDHIGCMTFHDGNNSMLYNLLKAEMSSQNESAKAYYKQLIESTIAGLQTTAAHGYQYPTDLGELRKRIEFDAIRWLTGLTTLENPKDVGEMRNKLLSDIGNNHAGSVSPFRAMTVLPPLFQLTEQHTTPDFRIKLIYEIIVDIFFSDTEYNGSEKERKRLENKVRKMIIDFSHNNTSFRDYLQKANISFTD